MVKLTRVGKKRPFLRGLLLAIVTVGLYGIYWVYKAPHEVYDQFDLHEERRDEGVVWLVTGLVVPLLAFVYFYKAVDNVRYVRRRLRLENGISPAGFILLQLAAPVVAIVLVAAMTVAAVGLNGDGEAAVAAMVMGMVAAMAAGVALTVWAYYRLQLDINEVWDAWRVRAAELREAQRQPVA